MLGTPSCDEGEPDAPRAAGNLPTEKFHPPLAPTGVAHQDKHSDDGDELEIGFAFTDVLGGEDDLFVGGEQSQAGDGELARDDDDDHPRGDERVIANARRGKGFWKMITSDVGFGIHFHSNEQNESGGNENFISQGIHQRAEVRL